MYHPEGIITSPNYPKRYNHELTCLWEINVEYGYNIEVMIHDLELEHSTNCQFDYLQLSNDPKFNTSIITICESMSEPSIITSESHKLYMKFNSDDSTNGKGFNMSYRSVLSDCGGTFTGFQGFISTPKYPSHNYENKKNCEWNIRTDSAHSLTFQMIDFDLETSDNCTKDYVEIYDPVFNKQLWRGCGNQLPNDTIFSSQRNELNVRLVTDDTITAKGFKGIFSQRCGGRIITNDTGEIHYTLSYSYSDRSVCLWSIISEDPAKKVTVTFIYMNLYLMDSGDGCISKIEVFDGDNDQGAVKASFCGVKSPPAITSNGNALTVKLNSSYISALSEFDIHYTVMDNCK